MMPNPTSLTVEQRHYGQGHFERAMPGDRQGDLWLLRFDDNDIRDLMFDDEAEAWAAWDRHAPGYNCYLFRIARFEADHLNSTDRLRDALMTAKALCEKIRDESVPAASTSEDYRQGFHNGANGCAFAILTEINKLAAITPAPSGEREAEELQACRFVDCPPGLFKFQGLLCFKSEYSSKPGQQDAYCVDSGEYFWGGTNGDLEARRNLMVVPVARAALQGHAS